MTPVVDHTHDPGLTSWVDSAADPVTDFPIQNLPLGVFGHGADSPQKIGIAIGDSILDIGACIASGLLGGIDLRVREACGSSRLNDLFALGRRGAESLRLAASDALRSDTEAGNSARRIRRDILKPSAECTLALPADVGDYTDFYASVNHATNVGAMFRPDNPLLPNYKWIPIGYHGRSSSIVPSGTTVHRPHGQTRPDAHAPPMFGASRLLDYELEVGAFIGPGNVLGGSGVRLGDTDAHLFGLVLVNDWSARDIQSWEYQPLGPFLAKNFGTTVSPWVVTLEALAPFRKAPLDRPPEDPPLLPYLHDEMDRANGAFDISLEVWLRTARMRAAGLDPIRLSRVAFDTMYWTFGQMLSHHASNGCNMRPGDLIASGTVSGSAPDSRGCLLELTQRGKTPLMLPNGEPRSFLEDGDEVTFRGWCERPGFRRIGFGECAGVVA
jgi:fumarylacetoacetase